MTSLGSPPSFRALGPLEVGPTDYVGNLGRRQSFLLAGLLAKPRSAVPVEEMCHWVWGEELPKSARRTIHSNVSRLRSQLLQEGVSDPINLTAAGYQLGVDELEVDWVRFDFLVDKAATSGDPATRSRELCAALALWRGRPFAGYEELAEPIISRLEEQMVSAREQLLDARLALGDRQRAIAEGRELLLEHPMRETSVALLMRALAEDGHQAEALRTFQRFRDELGSATGLEPSPAIRDLEAAILNGQVATDVWWDASAGQPDRWTQITSSPSTSHERAIDSDGVTLAEPELTYLAELSTFAHGFTPSSAAAVATSIPNDRAIIEPLLKGLGERGFLHIDADAARWVIAPEIAAHARHHLVSNGRLSACRDRLGAYLDRHCAQMRGPSRPTSLFPESTPDHEWAVAHIVDLRLATDRFRDVGDWPAAVRCGTWFAWAAAAVPDEREAAHRLIELLQMRRTQLSDSERMGLGVVGALLQHRAGHLGFAGEAHRKLAFEAETLGMYETQAFALGQAALVASHSDDDSAIRIMEQALRLSQRIDTPVMRTDACWQLGTLHLARGSTDRALTYLQDAAREAPLSYPAHGGIHRSLGLAAMYEGDPIMAVGQAMEGLQRSTDADARASSLLLQAAGHAALGNRSEACEVATLAVAQRTDDQFAIADHLAGLAMVAVELGHFDTACLVASCCRMRVRRNHWWRSVNGFCAYRWAVAKLKTSPPANHGDLRMQGALMPADQAMAHALTAFRGGDADASVRATFGQETSAGQGRLP